jgi:hypothetical protein
MRQSGLFAALTLGSQVEARPEVLECLCVVPARCGHSPSTAENMWRGTPIQSAHAPNSAYHPESSRQHRKPPRPRSCRFSLRDGLHRLSTRRARAGRETGPGVSPSVSLTRLCLSHGDGGARSAASRAPTPGRRPGLPRQPIAPGPPCGGEPVVSRPVPFLCCHAPDPMVVTQRDRYRALPAARPGPRGRRCGGRTTPPPGAAARRPARSRRSRAAPRHPGSAGTSWRFVASERS